MKSFIQILRFLLLPFSFVYLLIVKARNFLYERKYFKVKKLRCKVISIGNISTGGTGKTPFTIYLAKYFLNKNLTVGIISRGYKRKSSGVVPVSDGYVINRNYENTGDEMLMIAEELIKDYKGKFSMASGEKRYDAAVYLTDRFKPEIIILDDAFQHREIKRDMDILMLDTNAFMKNKLQNSFLLPAGNLREPFSEIHRADFIIQNDKYLKTGCNKTVKKINIPSGIIRYKNEYFVDNENCIFEKINKDVIIFSGIAQPDSFRKQLVNIGYDVEKEFIFNDHHEYSEAEIKNILSCYRDGVNFVTTQKDFVKIKKYDHLLKNYPVYYLKIRIGFSEGEEIFCSMVDKLFPAK